MSLVARGCVISGMLEEPPLECSDVEQAVRNRQYSMDSGMKETLPLRAARNRLVEKKN